MTEHLDVLIVGAGISGVGAAYHLTKQCPGKSFVVLETQDSFGGTCISPFGTRRCRSRPCSIGASSASAVAVDRSRVPRELEVAIKPPVISGS